MGVVDVTLRLNNFINKSKENHTVVYDYSKVIYINGETEVVIVCPIHGDFSQKPNIHVKGSDCPLCSRKKQIKKKSNTEAFIEKANLIHNNFYDYSKTIYTSVKDKVVITCRKHGDFEQQANSHLNGFGCMSCGRQRTVESNKFTQEEIVIKFNEIHNNRYDYSNVNYKNVHTKVEIICKLHGSFLQRPKTHLLGANCPRCNVKISKPENSVFEYIKSIYDGEIIQSYRPKWLEGKELDIFIPEFNFAIEYNGTSFHHSSKSEFIDKYYQKTYKNNNYHFNKWKTCKENNIILLSIYDFYWNIPNKKENYLSKISHYLKLDSKVYSRKCELVEIDNKDAFSFYEINHIEGSGFAYKNSKSFCLKYENEIVMCATIGEIYNQSSKSFKLKLQRIATKQRTTVVGGISKLTSFLKKEFGYFTYQITLSSGGSSLDFYNNYKQIQPRYFWVNPNTLEFYHRNFCQKHLLEKHFKKPLDSNDTESTYMEKLGYLKVYDNGLAELQI